MWAREAPPQFAEPLLIQLLTIRVFLSQAGPGTLPDEPGSAHAVLVDENCV
jgi:hypothetical protein